MRMNIDPRPHSSQTQHRWPLTSAVLALAVFVLTACGGGGTTEGSNQTGNPGGGGSNNNTNNNNNNNNNNPPTDPPPETTTRWSDPASWSNNTVPEAGENVLVPAGTSMLLDVDTASLGSLAIEGSLVGDDDQNISITATDLEIRDGGLLQIGSSSEPFTHKARITLTGARGVHTARPEDNGLDNDGVARGLRVRAGGSLVLVGETPSLTRSKLNAHAQAGATTFTLADSVEWKAGDQVAVSLTDFYNLGETEVLTLASDTFGAPAMVTTSGLQTFRWGRLQYPSDLTVNGSAMRLSPSTFTPASPETPTVLDERATVVNLTRNIVVEGADDGDWAASGFGVHVMIMGLQSRAQVDGVEFRRCGQRRAMGRYPFHWHMLSYSGNGDYNGDAQAGEHFLRNSTIHGSENRAVTIHGTCGVTVDNTYAVDVKGHAFFLEDGPERRNVISDCVAMHVREPAEPIKEHDEEASGFWLSNPDNTIVRNTASDCEGPGLDNSFATECFGLSRNVDMSPNELALGAFDDNVGHSCRKFGIRTAMVVVDEAGRLALAYYMHDAGDPVFNRNQIWKNGRGGYNNRVFKPHYNAWIAADNSGVDFSGGTKHGALNTSTLLIGSSLNNASPFHDPHRRGIASYHFTMDLVEITAINYPATSSTIAANGQFVYAGGALDMADLYLNPIVMQMVRSPGWRIINSSPGWRTPSPYFDSFPVQQSNGNRHWAISGAVFDAHGYWGPAGNYLVPDEPFYRHGLSSFQMATPGNNGLTTPHRFYGLGTITPGVDASVYSQSTDDPIRMQRLDNSGNVVDEHFIGDAASTSIFAFKHFGIQRGGRYRIVLPNTQPPNDYFNATVTNGYRAEDWFLLALPWDGSAPVQGRLDAGSSGGSLANRLQANTARLLTANGNSLADVIADSTGSTLWQDSSNNLVWFKHVGGLATNVDGGYNGISDESLWQRYQLRLSSQ